MENEINCPRCNQLAAETPDAINLLCGCSGFVIDSMVMYDDTTNEPIDDEPGNLFDEAAA